MSDWLDAHTRLAPAALRECVRRYAAEAAGVGTDAEVLARASRDALRRVAAQPAGGRAIALDLLAADALITLALLAQAQQQPDQLAAFASGLLQDPGGAA